VRANRAKIEAVITQSALGHQSGPGKGALQTRSKEFLVKVAIVFQEGNLQTESSKSCQKSGFKSLSRRDMTGGVDKPDGSLKRKWRDIY